MRNIEEIKEDPLWVALEVVSTADLANLIADTLGVPSERSAVEIMAHKILDRPEATGEERLAAEIVLAGLELSDQIRETNRQVQGTIETLASHHERAAERAARFDEIMARADTTEVETAERARRTRERIQTTLEQTLFEKAIREANLSRQNKEGQA